jgi:hypothetical protein
VRSLVSTLGLVTLAACAGSPPRAQVASHASAPPPSAAPTVASDEPPASPSPEPAPSAPSASDRVRARLDALTPMPGDDARWLPLRLLDAVAHASGELPAPAAPSNHGGAVVWSLVLPPATGRREPETYASVCDEVTRAEPRVLCAVDTVSVGASDRVRFAFGWREASPPGGADLALPLRALSRVHTGVCLQSAERTAHTLELRLRAPDLRALGTTLALMATVPRLSDVILVESEPMGNAIRFLVSWPTDRVDAHAGNLGDDLWPARCDDHATVAAEVPRRSPIVALIPIRGERAHGAVVTVARREWLITDGDVVGDAQITTADDHGVFVRRGANPRARPQRLTYMPHAPGTAQSGNTPPGTTTHSRTPQIPLPPEPPAPLP